MRRKNMNQSGGVSFGVVIGVVLVVGLVGWVLYHWTKVDTLERELEQTKSELEEVQGTAADAMEGVMEAKIEGAESVSDAIAGVDNPNLRLELFRAYVAKIKESLSDEGQEDVDEVVVYVEENLTVLMTADPELPDDIAAVVSRIEEELAEVDAGEVASAELELEEAAELAVGDEVEVAGVLKYAGEDPLTGGGVFILDSDEGYELYFTFSAENTVTYQQSLNGQQVSVTVEITAVEDNLVTYEVVSGPELAPVEEVDEEVGEEEEVEDVSEEEDEEEVTEEE